MSNQLDEFHQKLETLVVNHIHTNFPPVKSTAKIQPCILRYKGKIVKMLNGKCVWRRVGDAKNAIRNNMGGYYQVDNLVKEFEQDLFRNNRTLALAYAWKFIYSMFDFETVSVEDFALYSRKR